MTSESSVKRKWKYTPEYGQRCRARILADPIRHAAYVAYHRKWQRDRRDILQRNQNERNRQRKLRILTACGGKCSICGYDKCPAALEFHHPDPSVKETTVAKSRIYADALSEAQRCQLVCANCHREIHSSEPTVKRGRPRLP